MIEPTEEMKAAFRAAQEKRAGELVAEGAPLGGHDILDRGLAAVLAIVERDRADELADFRDRLAALAAIEDYIGESGQNAARNIRDLLAGTGDDDNDPRVQARRWELEW